MDAIEEIKIAQDYLTHEISRTFDELIKKLQNADEEVKTKISGKEYETFYPLSANPAIFKGNKPTCIMFGKDRIVAHTWKNVFKLVILRCNSDAKKHKELMELRNKILGRERILLSDSPRNMYRPFQIDKNLHVETHYDTESLLRILLHRILDEVDFDYSKISVAVRH